MLNRPVTASDSVLTTLSGIYQAHRPSPRKTPSGRQMFHLTTVALLKLSSILSHRNTTPVKKESRFMHFSVKCDTLEVKRPHERVTRKRTRHEAFSGYHPTHRVDDPVRGHGLAAVLAAVACWSGFPFCPARTL